MTFTKPFTVSTTNPMEVIAIDHIGPLRVKDQEGEKYILVMIDCFTRFVELAVTDSTDAKDTAACLFAFIGRYGTPLAIRSDRGTGFHSQLVEEVRTLMKLGWEFTLAHSKEENAIVERANKEIMRHLRAILLEGGIAEVFYEDIWMVQRIMNTSTHSSIGVAPATLLFGNAVDLDRRILYDVEYNDANFGKQRPLDSWVQERFEHQKLLLQAAAKHQKEIDVTNLAKRSPKELTQFKKDTYVLALHPDGRMGNLPPSKLQSYWQGPFQVMDVDNDVYTVKDLVTDENKVFYGKMLKAFEYDKEYDDPLDVAMKEAQLVLVETILDHRDTKGLNHIRDFEFHVKWKNRGEQFNQWLPWNQLRLNTVLHDYMRGKPELRAKIPKEGRR
jgi:transposase InsO family protein